MFTVPFVIRALPAAVFTLVLAAVSMQSFVLSDLLTISMLLILHPLYFWGIFKPQLFPVWLAFLLGFLIDIVSGTLLGLNAFLLVFVQIIVSRQRRYLLSQPFAAQWTSFMVIALGAELIRWLVMMLLNFMFFPPASALTSAVCCAAIYPVSALVMQACLRLVSSYQSKGTLEG